MSEIERAVKECVLAHTPEELALGFLRYECVRKLNPRQYAELWLMSGFDQQIDLLLAPPNRSKKA